MAVKSVYVSMRGETESCVMTPAISTLYCLVESMRISIAAEGAIAICSVLRILILKGYKETR